MGETGRSVYVIEDDDAVSRAFRRLLASAGYKAKEFKSGEEFLRHCEFAPNAWVICDLQLEGMSGIDVFNTLAKRSINMPFIFITALEDQILVTDAKRLGTAFFLKPVDGNQLLAALK